jgi:formamidopyrimidine-DNA glycosylase
MPELPDLQVFSRNLNKKIKGKTVKAISVERPKKLNVPVHQLNTALVQQILQQVERVGKELFFEFGNGKVLAIHLMLNGELHLFEKTHGHKYTVIELLFNDGSGLVLTDPRGFAKATLDPERPEAMDAFSEELNPPFLKEKLSQKKTPIKNFLLDQHIIQGIGNAYADEILWKAGLSPFSICNKIPEEKVNELTNSIKTVLEDAEKQILKKHPDIISGEVRDFLLIHHPDRKVSPNGAPIHTKKTGSRTTYYTDEQELFT